MNRRNRGNGGTGGRVAGRQTTLTAVQVFGLVALEAHAGLIVACA